MDAVGSRLGRSSSRYGPTAVFNGPVRRWKKKWVHVLPSKSTFSSSRAHDNGSGSSLFLCRWTPISSSNGPPVAAEEEEQPRKRKFRYAPIAMLDEQSKTAANKFNEEANRKATGNTDEIYKKPGVDKVENMQVMLAVQISLILCLVSDSSHLCAKTNMFHSSTLFPDLSQGQFARPSSGTVHQC
ncbi:hypothetical protein SAY87_021840 [Trapa incisa]|uniref:Uncharacterized protein n=2 Tax=Trapa TaxID=22665 RepID=A0AAN7MG76_TRANT|nr:hypothetical protein SAY87_021840 [Trapa incisa]KAK4804674.1 hypothetical protein SAY86_004491 [Trapa natans]